MPRKARVEGAKASKPEKPARIVPTPDEAEIGVIPEPEAPAEDKLANPVPGDDGDALSRIEASFRERFPEDWENIRLCPLQHGLPHMADLMRGRG
jgi:hypothetical protein